jgi:hypothetical protein
MRATSSAEHSILPQWLFLAVISQGARRDQARKLRIETLSVMSGCRRYSKLTESLA